METNLLRTSLAVLLATTSLVRLSAQTATSAPASDEVLELERFKVTSGVPVEQLVLPIARPFNSVFGTTTTSSTSRATSRSSPVSS